MVVGVIKHFIKVVVLLMIMAVVIVLMLLVIISLLVGDFNGFMWTVSFLIFIKELYDVGRVVRGLFPELFNH